MLCSFLLWTGTGNVNPGNHRIPGSRQTAASATKESSSHKRLRCLDYSSFFSSPHCEGDTLHCSDPLRTWKLWTEWFSHSGLCLTPAYVLLLQCWWSTWPEWLAAEAPNQLARLARHWTSRHSLLIWTVATMETAKRMFLSQWLLADTCMSALSSVLIELDCCMKAPSTGKTGKILN